MNRKEFIKKLTKLLKGLPKDEVENAIYYYEEYFDELNISDDKLLPESIKDPKQIAKEIKRDYLGNKINTNSGSVK